MNAMDSSHYCRDLLRSHGLLATRGGICILQVLRRAHKPLTHEQILQAVHASSDEPIGRVTLYRILKRLTEVGLCKKVLGSDRISRYVDPGGASDISFECFGCGAIESHKSDQSLARVIDRLVATMGDGGTRVSDITLSLKGKCSRCA